METLVAFAITVAVAIPCAWVAFGAPTSAHAATKPAAREILSKADADRIFAMSKDEWEAYATAGAEKSGGAARAMKLSDGSVQLALVDATGMGVSVHAMYGSDESKPEMVSVGAFFQKGMLPDEPGVADEIAKVCERQLGGKYQVFGSRMKFPPQITTTGDGIDLLISKPQQ